MRASQQARARRCRLHGHIRKPASKQIVGQGRTPTADIDHRRRHGQMQCIDQAQRFVQVRAEPARLCSRSCRDKSPCFQLSTAGLSMSTCSIIRAEVRQEREKHDLVAQAPAEISRPWNSATPGQASSRCGAYWRRISRRESLAECPSEAFATDQASSVNGLAGVARRSGAVVIMPSVASVNDAGVPARHRTAARVCCER